MAGTNQFNEVLPLLRSVAQGIARQFGPDCEVAVHDMTGEISSSIAIIENGHVTGRKVGDGASEAVLEALKNRDVEDRYSYFTNAKNGKMLKCTTVHIRDGAGEIIALLCINYDISGFTMANRTLSGFLAMDEGGTPVDGIPLDVNDLLDQLIEESHRHIGKPVSTMTKDEKKEAIRFLDQKGALLIKKSSERISEYYGISKYTLYNYLGESEDK
jgi:predicted transcriptional regulator YheO